MLNEGRAIRASDVLAVAGKGAVLNARFRRLLRCCGWVLTVANGRIDLIGRHVERCGFEAAKVLEGLRAGSGIAITDLDQEKATSLLSISHG